MESSQRTYSRRIRHEPLKKKRQNRKQEGFALASLWSGIAKDKAFSLIAPTPQTKLKALGPFKT